MKKFLQGLRFLLLMCALIFVGVTVQAHSSIFDNKAIFHDEEGKEVKMSDFLGHPTVMTMSYTECKKTCPLVTLVTLKKIQAELDAKSRKADIVILSFDPENDTPEVLKKFREKQKLTQPNWHFLTGSNADTRAAAKYLGLDHYWAMDDHILHGFKITIFSAEGDITRVLDWNNHEVTNLFP